MNRYILPTSTIIAGTECPFLSDFRDILKILQIFEDPDLLDSEKVSVALDNFYTTNDYYKDINLAISEMYDFLSCCKPNRAKDNEKPVYDWDKDYNIIISPINKVLGYDVRGKEYLHWWTFMSAFSEIGECTFSTYTTIRSKLNKNKKLEKYEEKILKEHREDIILPKKYDSATQEFMDLLMGKGD